MARGISCHIFLQISTEDFQKRRQTKKKKGFSQTIPNKPLLEYVTVIQVRIQNDAEV